MAALAYHPTTDEVAAVQAWVQANGFGSALTPWTLFDDDLPVMVPTTGGSENVRFGFGSGVLADFPQPGGTTDPASAQPTPSSAPATVPAFSPLLLVGVGFAVWYFLLRKRR